MFNNDKHKDGNAPSIVYIMFKSNQNKPTELKNILNKKSSILRIIAPYFDPNNIDEKSKKEFLKENPEIIYFV